MKFAHVLTLNAVPDWVSQYVDYDHLKKVVYRVEREHVQQMLDGQVSESKLEDGVFHKTTTEDSYAGSTHRTSLSSAIIIPEPDDDNRFIEECNKQLDKVCKFYESKEAEIFEEAKTLRAQFDNFGVLLSDETLARSLTCSVDSEHKLERLDSLLAGQQSSDVSIQVPVSKSPEKPSSGTQSFASRRQRRSSTSAIVQRGLATQGTPPEATRIPTSSTLLGRSKTIIEPPSKSEYMRDFSPHQLRGLRFMRRFDSRTTNRQQVTDMHEFNQYYNFRARCTSVYISMAELKSYIHLNHEAFHKITKKWDKVTRARLSDTYCKDVIDNAHPFQTARTQEIETGMKLIEQMYASVFTDGDLTSATSELKLHMRDHIRYERNSVWQDMVGKEREAYDAQAAQEIPGYHIPYINFFISVKTLNRIGSFLLAVAVYAVLMNIDTMGSKEANKCLALLIFVAMLWAFESLPLFATAYLIPLLIVPMDIIRDEGHRSMSSKDVSRAVFASMFNGTIAVLLGGFAIAAGLTRHGIAKAFAAVVMSKAGTKPHWVILANMFLSAFLCMWISNVATPVLCFSLARPILRTLPPNSNVGPCLILGIALACCIGGLSSPISSPQNIFAIQLMNPNPGWGTWFSTSIPLTITTILTTWGMLLLYFRPTRSTPRINAIKNQGYSKPSYSQMWVLIVCLATIGLWCTETIDLDFWGDNGVIALVPFVLLFGTNMLNKTDLNNFLWSVVTLAQGGMALGFAVERSGLLDIIGHRIAAGVSDMPVLGILFIFGVLVLVFATFVSHMVAALIILPIVKQVGEHLSPPHPNLLIMGTAMTASVAMGLPVSGFPNMNAIMQEDSTGKPYLHMKDFVLCGIPSSLMAGCITIVLGYGILSGTGY